MADGITPAACLEALETPMLDQLFKLRDAGTTVRPEAIAVAPAMGHNFFIEAALDPA